MMQKTRMVMEMISSPMLLRVDFVQVWCMIVWYLPFGGGGLPVCRVEGIRAV